MGGGGRQPGGPRDGAGRRPGTTAGRPGRGKEGKEAARRRRANFLRQVPLLRHLGHDDRAALADEMQAQRFADGVPIISKGERGDCMFILEQGGAAALVDGAEVKQYGAGGFFGELALITKQRRSADVVARGPVLALTLGRVSFERLVGNVGEKMEETRRRLRAAAYTGE